MKSIKIYDDGEISLFNTLRYFLNLRILKILLKFSILGVILGLVIALTTPKDFTSGTTLMPHTSESSPVGNLGSLSNLAGLAGIDISGSGSSTRFPLALYPNVVFSKTFKEDLLEAKFLFKGDSITFRTYLEEGVKPSAVGYVLSVPWMILDLFRGDSASEELDDDLIVVDKATKQLYKAIDNVIFLSIDEIYYLVQLNVTTQDPHLSLQVAKYVKNYLINYIEEYSTLKLKENLNFLEKAIAEKKVELNQVENELSRLIEGNQNVRSKKVELEIRNMEDYYDLIFSNLSSLQEEYEGVKLVIQKDTPTFSIINPLFLPIEKSSLSRLLILILVTIFVTGMTVLVLFVKKLKEDIG
ncbi:hypothetical protein [Ekhidna sp.]